MTSSFPFFLSFPFLLLLIHSTTITLSQTTAAPRQPTNIIKILEKAGEYSILIRLLRMTKVGDQIYTQLENSDHGMTFFAPTDNAFSSLKYSGSLNSLSDQEKVKLVEFHVIPTFISTSQFKSISNPLRTQAGESASHNYEFLLNISTFGNQVDISTGVVETTVGNTIYTDGGSLAVYQVEKVLLPMRMFGLAAPAPAPKSDEVECFVCDDRVPPSFRRGTKF